MRVGLVCPYSLTLPGGVQGQVLGLGRALRRLGVDARVLGPCDGPPPDTAVTPLGNSMPYAGNGSMAAVAPDPAAALRTIRALRDEAFDVVHVHEPFVPGPSLTTVAWAGSPMVGTFHRSGESQWYNALAPLGRWALRKVSVRTAVSEQARATAAEAFGGRYELVWNGIELEDYLHVKPWPSEGPTIAFVGRHEERKGLAVLLEAVERLGQGGPPGSVAQVWVVGTGPDTDHLRQRYGANPRIHWLGSLSEEEKIRRLSGADVFCAPSLHGESFGVVLLEAMAASAVVVASDLPGYRSVARPGVDAFLVPPGDPEALAQALQRALRPGPETRAMVASAELRAARFSMANLAERYLGFYEQAMQPEAQARSR